MSKDTTQDHNGWPFEERILARLDSIDQRLSALETQAEKRALETKPIWERALAEILEVKQSVANLDRKFDVLTKDMVQLRADQRYAESRIDRLEGRES